MNRRRLLAEFLGTAFLLVAIVGSGIATSVDGVTSSQLFQHAVVVGATLAALILTFGPVSGAHLNPSVTIVDAIFGGMGRRMAAGYITVQLIGAVLGVATANWIFGLPAMTVATVPRTGLELAASEAIAILGLLVVIFGTVRSSKPGTVAAAAGVYITAAIFFTSSTSFANPAVTLGRVLTDTWTGIAPSGIPGFLAGQAIGTLVAVGVIGYLFRPTVGEAQQVVAPHPQRMEERRHVQ